MDISLMQWNVWMHEKKEHILELIAAYKPDIVCLQELTAESPFQGNANVAEYLAKELLYRQFHYFVPNGTPNGIGRVANGIMTRLPILGTDWRWTQQPKLGGTDYERQYRLYVEATVEVGGEPLVIGTTHMSYTDRFKDIAPRQAEADELVKIARQHQKRYILTGDFNSVPGSYVVNQLERFMVHAGPSYDIKTWTTKPHSYNGFEETELNWRLDYVFVTDDISCVSAKAVRTGYSDHLPLIVNLRL